MKYFLVLFFSLFLEIGLFAQCDGGDPSANLSSWDYSKSIVENFNQARRDEEVNRSLTTNCLGNMTEISGGWNNATFDEIALYIHNSEREARGKLPLYGVETHLDAVSQAHSEWQVANEVFSHGGDPNLGSARTYAICGANNNQCGTNITGSSPSERMNQGILINQWEYKGENIAASVTSGATISSQLGLVTGLYRFMYTDAGSSWGHRHNMLHDYNDNWGDTGNEGFIGVGVQQGGPYKSCAFSCNSWNKVAITTINYYDPIASGTDFTFSAVLPVELIAFHVNKTEKDVYLTWATGSQENSEYFAIERSQDGIDFSAIGYVDVTGDTKLRTDYSFVDEHPLKGINYYRLRIVDFDAKEEYSAILSVGFFNDSPVALYPNPVRDVLQIKTADKAGVFQFDLYDLTGQIVLAEKGELKSIDMASIRSGAYHYVIKDRFGAVIKKGKLLKM